MERLDTTASTIRQRLGFLAQSPFRAQFELGPAERAQWSAKGAATIRRHAYELLSRRLAPATPLKDGRQTPWNGHPVFVAQHATATCCRGCLERWHRIPKGRALTPRQIDYVVAVIMSWLLQHVKRVDALPSAHSLGMPAAAVRRYRQRALSVAAGSA